MVVRIIIIAFKNAFKKIKNDKDLLHYQFSIFLPKNIEINLSF